MYSNAGYIDVYRNGSRTDQCRRMKQRLNAELPESVGTRTNQHRVRVTVDEE